MNEKTATYEQTIRNAHSAERFDRVEEILKEWGQWTEYHELCRATRFAGLLSRQFLVRRQIRNTKFFSHFEVLDLNDATQKWLLSYKSVQPEEFDLIRKVCLKYKSLSSTYVRKLHAFAEDEEECGALFCKANQSLNMKTFARLSPFVSSPASRSIVVGMCEAVAAIHESGIVHGELTPSYFEIEDSKPLLIGNICTTWFRPAHSPLLAPPERDFPNRTPTFESDVYALGACLYLISTGRPPFTQNSQNGSQVNRSVIHPSTFGVRLPANFVKLLFATMDPCPGNRIDSRALAAGALETYQT